MKKLYCLFAIFLICGLSGTAKATRLDLMDPHVGDYTIHGLYDLSGLSVTFLDCVEPGQLPVNNIFDGCYSFQNDTGLTITGIDLTISGLLPGALDCSLSGLLNALNNPLDIFPIGSTICSATASGYTLSYDDGVILPGEIITIGEQGVDPTKFPTVNFTATAATPEPGSLLLLSTGTVALGSFLNKRRRSTGTTDRS
jgi:hypothetical protein